ncbi:MAG: MoxR family ATPase [Pseudomonadota bacterium]
MAAVNTAITLGKPLLVSGDPGVGKTSLARYVAWRLGLMREGPFELEPEVLRFDVKSTTKGADLIYRYDAISHFRQGQWSDDEKSKKEIMASSLSEHIRLNALGTAIALGAARDDDGSLTSVDPESSLAKVIGQALDACPMSDEPRTSVVLIDEIDKAPRDVPNDLLRELDDMVFEIPELGGGAHLPQPEIRPIVIITTNDERTLPAPFLRRCCFLHIAFPEDIEDVRQIIRAQLPEKWDKSDIVSDAIALVHAIRRKPSDRPPATAELIEFILRLHDLELQPDHRLAPVPETYSAWPVEAKAAANILTRSKDGERVVREALEDLQSRRG